MFDPRCFDLGHKYGFSTLLVNVLNIPFVVAAEAFIVEKANKCLDFTVTIFINHIIIICFWFGRFPLGFRFYFTNALIIVFTVLAAECFCMRLEQQEIKLTFDQEGISNIVQQSKKVYKEVEGAVRDQIQKQK